MSPDSPFVFNQGDFDFASLQLPQSGEVIGGYKLLNEIGEGGMGVVYQAQDINLDRMVAIKFLNIPEIAARTRSSLVINEMKQRFLREARLSAKIDHPNAVRIFAADLEGEFPYFVMDLLRGKTLQEIFQKEGKLEAKATICLGQAVTSALRSAWEGFHIVHRDLKPANIMIDDEGLTKVMDFGIARVFAKQHQTVQITQAGTSVGSPRFKSPEQHRGGAEIDCRSDMYALGTILCHALCGQFPFLAKSEATLYQMKEKGFKWETSEHLESKDIPPLWRSLVEDLLAAKPDDRPQDYGEVEERLAEIMEAHEAEEATSPEAEDEAPDGEKTEEHSTVVIWDGALASSSLPRAFLRELQTILKRVAPGKKVGGFEIVRHIGYGGMGAVYEAISPSGERVALKFILQHDSRGKSSIREVEREAGKLRHLDHTSIVKVRRFEYRDDLYFMITDLFLGPDQRSVNLRDYATGFGPGNGMLDDNDMRQIALAMLGALEYAHTRQVVHCNLKPENILFDCVSIGDDYWNAHVKLTDFGLARVVGETFVHDSIRASMSRFPTGGNMPNDARALLNSFDYMSPEQRQGEPAGPLSDIFSVGMILLNMLTGAKELGLGGRPSLLREGLNPAWDEIIPKALENDCEKRFQSAAKMADAIRLM